MKQEKGFSLIEVALAMLLLGIVAVAFFVALSTGAKALLIADERTTAESLARSQMEYVKNQDYITAADDDEVTYEKIAEISEGYTIWSVNRTGSVVNGDNSDPIIAVPWDSQNNLPVDEDAGLQRIKLVIKHLGKEVLTLEDYKVDR